MELKYTMKPVEGQVFVIEADKARNRVFFVAYINGEPFWQHECDDPPCHERFKIPDEVAGSTLLITAKDSDEQRELTFFIDDDGNGLFQGERVLDLAPQMTM